VAELAEHPLCDRCGERHPDWQRCPFQPENQLAVKHGSYATVALGPRVDELADEIRDLVPVYTPSDEIALRLLCLALARQERAEAALAEADASDATKLRQDALGWANAARRLLNDLGMTPSSRAKLGLNVARARGAALREHLREHYPDDQS
jgi:hypothetical protein